MSILVDENIRLLVQGITGSEGSFHTQRCIEYGTKVVAGVTPGKGGGKHLDVSVFNTVEKAIAETGANASLMFVPPAFAADGILEATEAGMSLIVCITEGIPVLDMVKVHHFLKGNQPDSSVLIARELCPQANVRLGLWWVKFIYPAMWE